MRKIKISELPLCETLKGLFTIGTDNQNRSVKVSLEFVETKTNEAVQEAEQATAKAKTAAATAQEKASAAQTATDVCNTATDKANAATAAANKAKADADTATAAANAATTEATEATENANKATQSATAAASKANASSEKADTAAAGATSATDAVLAAFAKLIPTGLKVYCLNRLTVGNLADKYIKAILEPEGTMHNVMFVSDNKAVSVAPDGRLSIVGKGYSLVHIVPTCNTALTKSVVIEVGDPTMRLVNTRKQMRFTSSGAIRLN